MNGNYELNLMLASWCAAVAAAYAALDLGGRIADFEGLRRRLWLMASALAVGSGIWSAHSVGIQALRLPELSFSLGWSLLSWLAAVAVSLLGLSVIAGGRPGARGVAGGGLAMGLGLCVTHYAGLYALHLAPHIGYAHGPVAASLLLAVGLCAAILAFGFSMQRVPEWQLVPAKTCGAVLLGAALFCMRCSVMAAAHIPHGALCAPGNALSGQWLGLPAALIGMGLMAAVMLSTMFEARRLQKRWLERERFMTARFRRRVARG